LHGAQRINLLEGAWSTHAMEEDGERENPPIPDLHPYTPHQEP